MWVLTFLVCGDQNAGKSPFLHSFSYTDEPAWLSLSSFLPILSSAFLNVRLLAADDDTPPRDELPYLDTDIGRSNFLMTAENFAFFMQEMGLGEAPELRDCLAHDSRFVLTQFIEIGGDHLDRLLARPAREPAAPTAAARWGCSAPSRAWPPARARTTCRRRPAARGASSTTRPTP